MKLSTFELRIIGCLVEKSLTTPDQYPLSLNALTNACNQKSNREPVLSLTELEVQNSVDELAKKGLIFNQSGATSRVAKYKHRFCNSEFGELQLTAQELAIICVLFLRGPQTPGELRTRTNRLCEFADVHETEQVLNQLSEGGKDAKVIKLAREPGKRESRYAHCFSDDSEQELHDLDTYNENKSNQSLATKFEETPDKLHEVRLVALEEQVELLQLELEELREMINNK